MFSSVVELFSLMKRVLKKCRLIKSLSAAEGVTQAFVRVLKAYLDTVLEGRAKQGGPVSFFVRG